nr:MAG TPA: hypothetical protein [Caudoviricetes sp.]
MARKLAECGTWGAYKRHLRAKEPPCEECAKAAREYNANRRARAAEEKRRFHAQPAEQTQVVEQVKIKPRARDGFEIVSQLVAYGHVKEIEVPTFEDPLESARWRRARIRAALVVANPRDVAPLAKAEQECIEEIAQLTAAQKPEGESMLEKLAARRQERMLAAQRASTGEEDSEE